MPDQYRRKAGEPVEAVRYRAGDDIAPYMLRRGFVNYGDPVGTPVFRLGPCRYAPPPDDCWIVFGPGHTLEYVPPDVFSRYYEPVPVAKPGPVLYGDRSECDLPEDIDYTRGVVTAEGVFE